MRGERLGPYRLEAELGSGGMGTVYRARAVEPAPPVAVGTTVALKLVHPHLVTRADGLARLRREAELGGRVVHAHVGRTFGADAADFGGHAQPYLVMEYVEGRTLNALLDELHHVPEELCWHIGREVVKGL